MRDKSVLVFGSSLSENVNLLAIIKCFLSLLMHEISKDEDIKIRYIQIFVVFKLPPMISPIPTAIPFNPTKLLACVPKLFVLPIAVP